MIPRMKTIGMIGGMSWESTLPYYRIVNETAKARLGGLHSARVVLYSVDFADVEHMQHAGLRLPGLPGWRSGSRLDACFPPTHG